MEKSIEIKPEIGMSVMDAIYKRQSVRSYTPQVVDKVTILTLLDAAVHAPTAIDEQPWAFIVIQDSNTLRSLSDSAKKIIGSETKSHAVSHSLDHFLRADFNIFYDAGTLIVICSKPMGPFAQADCWLAAENLVLAARSIGLSTCIIGSAVAALNMPEWKATLQIPTSMTAIAPVILGVQSSETKVVLRKKPEILLWK